MIKFIFVKVAQYLILPPTIFIIFLTIFRRFKKIVYLTSFIFLLISTEFIGHILLYPLEKEFYNTNSAKVNAIVILGGGYNKDAPNLAVNDGAFKRLIYGIMIAKKENLPIIFDGSANEAKVVYNTIQELNSSLNLDLPIAKGSFSKKFSIHIQGKALTTIDNAKYVKEYLAKNEIEKPKIYLVTSAYHMKRAIKEFKRQNIYTIPRATDFKSTKEIRFIYFLPNAEGLRLSFLALHEYLAFLRDFILRR